MFEYAELPRVLIWQGTRRFNLWRNIAGSLHSTVDKFGARGTPTSELPSGLGYTCLHHTIHMRVVSSIAIACLAASVSGIVFTPEQQIESLKVREKVLSDRLKLGAAPANCSVDMRARLPACKQQGADWCWATGVAEWAFFYGKVNESAQCDDVECAVVSSDMHTQCCPYNEHRGCGADGSDVATITKVASAFVGRTFSSEGLLSEEKFQSILMSGRPVMPIIQWQKGGGHALMVSGCFAKETPFGTQSMYFLHDPERTYYSNVSYEFMVNYLGLQPGKWVNSIY